MCIALKSVQSGCTVLQPKMSRTLAAAPAATAPATAATLTVSRVVGLLLGKGLTAMPAEADAIQCGAQVESTTGRDWDVN